MALNVGNLPVKQVYVGSTPVREVYVGSKLVWSATVQITLGTDLEARDQFRAALSDRGLDYRTVTEVPFEIELVGTGSARDLFRDCAALTSVPPMDTSGVTNMRSMFNACNALTSVPAMDTSQVTNMAWMFTHCYALTTVPAMDTSKVTTMNNMFDYCLPLTYVPDMDTSQVTNMNQMFYGCSALTDGNVLLIGKHPSVTTTNMISGSGLTREPFDMVQITLGTGFEARDQFRAALTERGLNYQTVTEIPFEIELVGSGSIQEMFRHCSALRTGPVMDTSNVTNMSRMFHSCYALTSVPDMNTSQVTDMSFTFYYCQSLTDGNASLTGRNPNVYTSNMIVGSSLTREPWYSANGRPIEVYDVSLTDVQGSGRVHPLVSVTVPAGGTWGVRVQGTVTRASSNSSAQPQVRIGGTTFGPYAQGTVVDESGTVTSADNTIAILTRSSTSTSKVSFTGTVTIEK